MLPTLVNAIFIIKSPWMSDDNHHAPHNGVCSKMEVKTPILVEWGDSKDVSLFRKWRMEKGGAFKKVANREVEKSPKEEIMPSLIVYCGTFYYI